MMSSGGTAAVRPQVGGLHEQHAQALAHVGRHLQRIVVGEHLHELLGTLALGAATETADPGERLVAVGQAVLQAPADRRADVAAWSAGRGRGGRR